MGVVISSARQPRMCNCLRLRRSVPSSSTSLTPLRCFRDSMVRANLVPLVLSFPLFKIPPELAAVAVVQNFVAGDSRARPATGVVDPRFLRLAGRNNLWLSSVRLLSQIISRYSFTPTSRTSTSPTAPSVTSTTNMNASAVRRPLGPVKTLLRQSRQHRLLFQRSMATESAPTTTDTPAGSIPPVGIASRKPQRFRKFFFFFFFFFFLFFLVYTPETFYPILGNASDATSKKFRRHPLQQSRQTHPDRLRSLRPPDLGPRSPPVAPTLLPRTAGPPP